MPKTKRCTKCGKRRSLGCFYFRSKQTGERFSWCKDCHNRITLARYYANHEAGKKQRRDYQRSVPVEKKRERSLRWRQKHREKIREEGRLKYPLRREKKKAYRQANADRIKARNAEYRANNRDTIKAQWADYYRRNRAMILERYRQWRKDNPEKDKEVHRKWKSANRDKCNAAGHRRRCKMTENGGDYTAAEWQEQKRRQDFRCLMCKRQEPEIKLTVDHIIPVNDGGPNCIENIQGLCRSCNAWKHTKVLDLRNAAAG